MSRHVTRLLYDYVVEDLPLNERERIERHLATCKSCRSGLDTLRAALSLLPRSEQQPSEQRDEAFWASFVSSVEQELLSSGKRPSLFAGLGEVISRFVQLNTTALLAGSSALAVIALAAILLWPHETDIETSSAQRTPPSVAFRLAPGAGRVHEYLKRSKVLLVGLSNMRTGGPVDLSVERQQSRALVNEARYLRQQPLDARSAKLVGDIERLMIGLANASDEHGMPDMIRSGVRRENLLFKIRMTESLLETGAKERARP